MNNRKSDDGTSSAMPGDGPLTTLEKEIADRMDAGEISPLQFRIIFICTLLAILDGYDFASMGLAVPLITHEWKIAAGAFGTPLSAVWIGVATGSIVFGWLGDRIGRKPVVIASATVIGLASLGTITSPDLTVMTLWRFLLGVAFGAGLPNIYALVADVVPARRRIFCMTLLTAATSIGGILGGLVAPSLSAWLGWKGIFLAGGVLPLLLALFMIFLLKESPKVLAARHRMQELYSVLAAFRLSNRDLPETRAGAAVKMSRPIELLQNGLWFVTACYLFGWICSGMTFYMVANWMPTLLINSGWSGATAQRSITLIYAGCMVGGLCLSWIMDRWSHGLFAPAIGYGTSVILFIAAGYWFTSSAIHMILVGLGLAIGGAQYVLPALAARIYPARLLATALSWIGALARVGGICGPLVGGWMLLSGWSPTRIMITLSVAPLLSTLAFVALAVAMTRRSDAATSQAVPKRNEGRPIEVKAMAESAS
jgi:AAHS family 4-hydroxybenzoate transporter-like MFS transporter